MIEGGVRPICEGGAIKNHVQNVCRMARWSRELIHAVHEAYLQGFSWIWHLSPHLALNSHLCIESRVFTNTSFSCCKSASTERSKASCCGAEKVVPFWSESFLSSISKNFSRRSLRCGCCCVDRKASTRNPPSLGRCLGVSRVSLCSNS